MEREIFGKICRARRKDRYLSDIDVPQASAERGGSAGSMARRGAARRGKARGEFNVAVGCARRPEDHTERNGWLESIRSSRERDGRKSESAERRRPARSGATPRSRAFSRTHARVSQARASVPRAVPRGTRPPARKRAPPARRRGARRGARHGDRTLKGGVASRAAKWRPR